MHTRYCEFLKKIPLYLYFLHSSMHTWCRCPPESEFLLLIRLMTFIHQDLWCGKLVPSSHQRGEPSHTILCTFNRGKNRIWKGIPVGRMGPCKCHFLHWGSEKSMSDDFYCALLCVGGGTEGGGRWGQGGAGGDGGGGQVVWGGGERRGGGRWGEGGGVIKSSVWMLAAPFRLFYKRIGLLSLLFFLRDFHFSFSSIRHTPSFKTVTASNY